MKFKCNITSCVYTFTEPLDIKAMKMSQDYTEVPEGKDPVGPATIAPVVPKPVAPVKPLPVVPAPTKAV